MLHHAKQLLPHRPRITALGLLFFTALLSLWPATLQAAEAVVPSASTAATSAASLTPPPADSEHIAQLIQQLGDGRFSVRRTASNELRQIGAEAFDQLHAATESTDPEIAASANYLLRQISIRWVRNDDPPALRSLMRDFGRLSENNRLRRLEQITVLEDGQGIAGLCRIARYDRSPLVSRLAALEVIEPDDDKQNPPVEAALFERELGGSTRVSVDWLRRYLAQQSDPAGAAESWQKLVDDETARLDQKADDTSPAIVAGLLWNLARLQHQLGRKDAVFPTLDRMMTVYQEDPDTSQSTTVQVLKWLADQKAWNVTDKFLDKYQSQIDDNKRLLYYAALLRSAQGNAAAAEQLAEKASKTDVQNGYSPLLGVSIARELETKNQFDWAVREYRNSITENNLTTEQGVFARIYLATLLHDYAQYEEAANVLEPLARAVNNKGRSGEKYAEMRRIYSGLTLPKSESLLARLHFYRACQYHEAKDWERERQALTDSIRFDPTDADVIIAMYRVPESNEAWKAGVRERIEKMSNQFQQEIDENPGQQDPYNQWAWLISNTEGDYQKAIRYSHRSLELNDRGKSNAAGYLDTLGRCYFAAGDLENAVKYQRQAVEKIGYMQVMRRQLAQFEKALAEKQEK